MGHDLGVVEAFGHGGEYRLQGRGGVHCTGQQRLLDTIGAHGDDLDGVAADAQAFVQPVAQYRVGYRALGEGGDLGPTAFALGKVGDGLGRVGVGHQAGQFAAGDQADLLLDGGRQYLDRYPVGASHHGRADTEVHDVEITRGQRLDHRRPAGKACQLKFQTGLFGPAFTLHHE